MSKWWILFRIRTARSIFLSLMVKIKCIFSKMLCCCDLNRFLCEITWFHILLFYYGITIDKKWWILWSLQSQIYFIFEHQNCQEFFLSQKLLVCINSVNMIAFNVTFKSLHLGLKSFSEVRKNFGICNLLHNLLISI